MVENSFSFCEVTPSDFHRVAAFFHKYGHGPRNIDSLRSKYVDSPLGPGRIFTIETPTQEIKGTLGYIPHVLLDNRNIPIPVMQCVDLFFTHEVRGQKLYPKFMRFSSQRVTGPIIAFPNKRSQKITIDIGWKIAAPIYRWVFPISLDYNKSSKALKPLYSFINRFFYFYRNIFLRHRQRTITLRFVDSFGRELDRVSHPRHLVLSADFLNWRFARHDTTEYKLVEFMNQGLLCGYCVFKIEEPTAIIYDLFSRKHLHACSRALVDYCSTRSIHSVFFPGSGHNLSRLGFVRLSPDAGMLSYRLPDRRYKFSLKDSDW